MQVTNLRPLQPYLSSPDVVEVMVVNGTDIWVERTNGIVHEGSITSSDVAHVVEGISRLSGRRVDTMSPILDARLPDGSRACVVLPPVSIHGVSINIRKFPSRVLPLAAFATEKVCNQVRQLVTSHANVVVSGATSTGKTSLISAATEWFEPEERVVCVEDTAEIRCRYAHAVYLQTRPANQEGNGLISLHHLVTTSLRMRPDRLIVGEVRGEEVVDMLLALSSGHTGSWTSVHAVSADHTVARLASLLQRHHPQWSRATSIDLVTSAIDAVIHLERLPHGRRFISDVLVFNKNMTTAS
ncbi:MAG: CpaF family protein [Ilumatobacteraceae bacterium]